MNESEQPNQQPNLDPQVVDYSRRNFTRGGLSVGAAVIASVASRPALGTYSCNTPSAFLSANLSTHGTPPSCTGKHPSWWCSNTSQWPTSGTSPCFIPDTKDSKGNWRNDGTKYHPLCSGSFFVYNSTSGPTSYSVTKVMAGKAGKDPAQLGAYIAAALLNARSGRTPVLTVADVLAIWNEYTATGGYQPSAGVQWTASQIVTYLQSTMV